MPNEYLEYSEPGDDYQVADLVPFASSVAVGSVAADIQFEGSLTCTCPDNYVMVAQQVSLANATGTAIQGKIQITNGTVTVILLEVTLAANTAAGGNQFISQTAFRLIAPPGFKFQAISSAASSLDVQMLVRLTRGAGL